MTSRHHTRLAAALAGISAVLTPSLTFAEEVETITPDDIDYAEGTESQPNAIDPAADRAARTAAPEVDLEAISEAEANDVEPTLEEPTFAYETTRDTFPNVPLLVTGTTIFAAAYVPAIVGGALSDRGDDDLYVPLAGPWMTLANGPSETGGQKTLLIADGAAQAAGAFGMLLSFFVPQSRTKSWYLIGDSSFNVSPRGAGVMAAGQF